MDIGADPKPGTDVPNVDANGDGLTALGAELAPNIGAAAGVDMVVVEMPPKAGDGVTDPNTEAVVVLAGAAPNPDDGVAAAAPKVNSDEAVVVGCGTVDDLVPNVLEATLVLTAPKPDNDDDGRKEADETAGEAVDGCVPKVADVEMADGPLKAPVKL